MGLGIGPSELSRQMGQGLSQGLGEGLGLRTPLELGYWLSYRGGLQAGLGDFGPEMD